MTRDGFAFFVTMWWRAVKPHGYLATWVEFAPMDDYDDALDVEPEGWVP